MFRGFSSCQSKINFSFLKTEFLVSFHFLWKVVSKDPVTRVIKKKPPSNSVKYLNSLLCSAQIIHAEAYRQFVA